MQFICTNKECKHTFYPHSHIAFRHPLLAKCPKCKERAVRSKKGIEDMKEYHKDRREGKFGNKGPKLIS